jgi:hypothetical protein
VNPDTAFYLNANLDPDSAFYLNADPNPGNQIHSDADPGQTLKSQTVNFSMLNNLKAGNRSTYEGKKDFLKDRKPGLFVNFGKFPCSWIRIPFPIRILIPAKQIHANPFFTFLKYEKVKSWKKVPFKQVPLHVLTL